ncbi:MAG: hypothetical protein J6J36_06075 [Clostridia bacterium]|nr:hypothetical protein [Clostridia bacterium]
MKYNIQNENHMSSAIQLAQQIEKYIFGGIDDTSGKIIKGINKRPTQQDKDPEVKRYGFKISSIQQAYSKIIEFEAAGGDITDKQKELKTIMERINKSYPPQQKISRLKKAQDLSDYIYGTFNEETKELEGGLNRRPSERAKDPSEAEKGIDLSDLRKVTSQYKKKLANGEVLSKDKLELIKIVDKIYEDFPLTINFRALINTAKELDIYIRGEVDPKSGEKIHGIERRPLESSKDEFEAKRAEDLHMLKKKVKGFKVKRESGETLTSEQEQIIEIVDNIDKDYPVRIVRNYTENARAIKEYIYGRYDEETGSGTKGLERRPSYYSKDDVERNMASRLSNVTAKVRELKKARDKGEELSDDEKEMIEIVDQIYTDYPAVGTLIDSARRLYQYVYGYTDKTTGEYIPGADKRPATSSSDPTERKMANILCSIRNYVDELREKNSLLIETSGNPNIDSIVQLKELNDIDINDEDIILIQFLRKLDMDYPSQKKRRIPALKFCDAVIDANISHCKEQDYILEVLTGIIKEPETEQLDPNKN